MNNRIYFIVLLAMALLVQGCAVLTSNPYYKPSTTEVGEGKTDIGGALFVRFGGQNFLSVKRDEAEVGVRSIGNINYPMAMGPVLPVIPTFMTAPDKAYPNVLLEIYLQPRTENFTFNPMSVRVKNGKGMVFTPASYINSVAGGFTFYRGDKITNESLEINLNKDSRYCFVLDFDMRESPDWDITMQLNGMKTDRKEISAPEFQFQRGTAIYVMWGGRQKFCSE